MSASTSVDFGLDFTDPSTWVPFIWSFGTKAAGVGTPAEQIVASITIAAVAVAASYLTLGATLIVVLPALFFAFVGFVRLFWRMVA